MKKVNQIITQKNNSLIEEEKELIEQYESLEQEKKVAEVVIMCQIRKDEIQKEQKSIEQKLYEVKRKLLQENEEYVKKGNGE